MSSHKKFMMSEASVLLIAIIFSSCTTTKSNSVNPIRPRVNHVFLSVANIDSSIAFYLKAFDLKETNRLEKLRVEQGDSVVERNVKIAFLKFDGQDFVFEISERSPTTSSNTSGTQLYQHVGVEVNDIEAAYKRLEAAGGKMYVPIRTTHTHNLEVKQAFFRGPDGEAIELVQVLSGHY